VESIPMFLSFLPYPFCYIFKFCVHDVLSRLLWPLFLHFVICTFSTRCMASASLGFYMLNSRNFLEMRSKPELSSNGSCLSNCFFVHTVDTVFQFSFLLLNTFFKNFSYKSTSGNIPTQCLDFRKRCRVNICNDWEFISNEIRKTIFHVFELLLNWIHLVHYYKVLI